MVKLFSSNSVLEEVPLPSSERIQVDRIQPMDLPNLSYLFLDPPPKSTQVGDSSLFFKNLNAPRLEILHVDSLKPQDLAFLSTTSSLEELYLYDLQIKDSASAKAAASALIDSTKDWSKLRWLVLVLPPSTPSIFYEQLVQLLIPLSTEGIRAGFRDRMPFPGLRLLRINPRGHLKTSTVI